MCAYRPCVWVCVFVLYFCMYLYVKCSYAVMYVCVIALTAVMAAYERVLNCQMFKVYAIES